MRLEGIPPTFLPALRTITITVLISTAVLIVAVLSYLLLRPGRPPGMLDQGSAASKSGCGQPAQVLDLSNWKLTLPVAKPGDTERPLEITQPGLADYILRPWLNTTTDCHAVLFRAPVNGVTTSGSHNPRSELREMKDHGSKMASWSSTTGVHRMTVTEAFTHLPKGKPDLVGAQIHDSDNDISVFRLEGTSLYITKGKQSHYKRVTDHYVLGAKFDATYEVGDGEVRAYYNGSLQATIAAKFHGAYFKAGAYTQANCDNSSPCASSNYGETAIFRLSVHHQGNS